MDEQQPTSTLSSLTALFVKKFPGFTAADIKPQAKLGEDIGLDSLDQVELQMAVEREFDVSIESEFRYQTTIADIVKWIDAELSLRPIAPALPAADEQPASATVA